MIASRWCIRLYPELFPLVFLWCWSKLGYGELTLHLNHRCRAFFTNGRLKHHVERALGKPGWVAGKMQPSSHRHHRHHRHTGYRSSFPWQANPGRGNAPGVKYESPSPIHPALHCTAVVNSPNCRSIRHNEQSYTNAPPPPRHDLHWVPGVRDRSIARGQPPEPYRHGFFTIL